MRFSSSWSVFIVRDKLIGTMLLREGVELMFLRMLPLNTNLLFSVSFNDFYLLVSSVVVGRRLPYLVDKLDLDFLFMSGRKSDKWLLPSVTNLLLVFSETSVVKRVFSVF